MWKMTALLLVPGLSLLIISSLATPTHRKPESNLNIIFDEAERYNESFNKEFYVEDVGSLVDAGCGDTFFCKVHDILHKRQEHSTHSLVKNLKAFTDQRNVNCSQLIKDVPSTGVLIQLPKLMKHLTTCVKRRNWGKKATTANLLPGN